MNDLFNNIIAWTLVLTRIFHSNTEEIVDKSEKQGRSTIVATGVVIFDTVLIGLPYLRLAMPIRANKPEPKSQVVAGSGTSADDAIVNSSANR